jgi:hypothetical protein
MSGPWFTELPSDREVRLARVRGFLRDWGAPAAGGTSPALFDAAEAGLGAPLPRALRELYAELGPSAPCLSGQDWWLPVDRLRREGDALLVRVENQSCERWGVRLADMTLDDPPVVELDSGETAEDTLSGFAIKVLLYERGFAVGGAIRLFGEPEPWEAWRALADAALERCPLSERYWVCTPLRIWEGPGVVLWSTCDTQVFGAVARERELARIHALIEGFEVG